MAEWSVLAMCGPHIMLSKMTIRHRYHYTQLSNREKNWEINQLPTNRQFYLPLLVRHHVYGCISQQKTIFKSTNIWYVASYHKSIPWIILCNFCLYRTMDLGNTSFSPCEFFQYTALSHTLNCTTNHAWPWYGNCLQFIMAALMLVCNITAIKLYCWQHVT